MKQANVPHFSGSISEVISMMENAKRDYEWNLKEVQRLESLTQDYLHHLELDGLNYKERAKVATQLAACRQERRNHKDMVISLEPLVDYLETDRGKTMLNMLKEALGKTRKIEKYMETRKYYPRVLGQGGDS